MGTIQVTQESTRALRLTDALLEDPPSSLPSKLDLMAAAQCLLVQASEGDLPFNRADRERASALARML
jgi:hypothetical protein